MKPKKKNDDETNEARKFKENYEYELGEPEYGTKEWWAWSEKQADEDIQAGKVKTLNSKEKIDEFFDNLQAVSEQANLSDEEAMEIANESKHASRKKESEK